MSATTTGNGSLAGINPSRLFLGSCMSLVSTSVAFGAITSLPKEECEAALVPELQGQGHIYASPIVRLRQEFNLRTNLRPCKAYPGNPLNYKDNIDLVVFRENTEDLYVGIEFHPLPDEVRAALKNNHPKMARFDNTPGEDIAVSLRSAGQLGINPLLKPLYPRVCLFVNDDMHGYSEVLGLGVLNSYVRPAATYQTIIRDLIGGQDQGCPAAAPTVITFLPVVLNQYISR